MKKIRESYENDIAAMNVSCLAEWALSGTRTMERFRCEGPLEVTWPSRGVAPYRARFKVK